MRTYIVFGLVISLAACSSIERKTRSARTGDDGRARRHGTSKSPSSENGKAIFERRDLIIESNKTAMTETPLVVANTSTTVVNGYSGNKPIAGAATNNVLRSRWAAADRYVRDEHRANKYRRRARRPLTAQGHVLTLISARNNGISYSIR
jgi:hypothetical protein